MIKSLYTVEDTKIILFLRYQTVIYLAMGSTSNQQHWPWRNSCKANRIFFTLLQTTQLKLNTAALIQRILPATVEAGAESGGCASSRQLAHSVRLLSLFLVLDPCRLRIQGAGEETIVNYYQKYNGAAVLQLLWFCLRRQRRKRSVERNSAEYSSRGGRTEMTTPDPLITARTAFPIKTFIYMDRKLIKRSFLMSAYLNIDIFQVMEGYMRFLNRPVLLV